MLLLSRHLVQIRSWQVAIGIGLWLALLLTALAYWPGLHGGFLLDDYENLRALNDLDEGRLAWRDAIFSTHAGPLDRPVAMATFVANMVFSGPDVWMFKYTNLMIHLLCGVLVFWLSGHLIAMLRPAYQRSRICGAALAVAALWLLTPLSVSTTLYLVQRMTQLSALFSLAGLLAYVLGREELETTPARSWILIASSVLLWMPLACFSKETGILLPLLLFTVEIFVFRFAGSTRTRRRLYLFFIAILILPAAAGLIVLLTHPSYFFGGYAGRTFTLGQRLMTEMRVLFFYLQNLLVPQGRTLGLFHDDFIVSKGLFSPITTVLALAAWTLVCAITPLLRKSTWWPLMFGLWFFLAGHALESTVFPLELVFEHRNYLPSYGIFLSLVLALFSLRDRLPDSKPLLGFIIALPLAYGFATYQRADTWSSWDKILLSAENAHPASPRVHAELASLYSLAGDLKNSLSELNEVQQLRPDTASAVALHRLIVYCEVQQPIPETAYMDFPDRMAETEAGTYTINTLRAVTREIYTGKCPSINVKLLVPRLDAWARNAGANANGGRLWDLHYEVAQMLRFDGQTKKAISHLREAYKLDPARPEPLLVMMRYQMEMHDIGAARATLQELRTDFRNPSRESERLIRTYQQLEETIDNSTTHNGEIPSLH